MTFAPEIRDDKECVETLQRLAAPIDGISRSKHIFVLRKASTRLGGRYYTEFKTNSFKNDELRRIDLLSDVLLHAKQQVFAYSYADGEYLRHFWGSTDRAIERYFAAHQEVLNRSKRQITLERIFVYPDGLLEIAPTAYSILVTTIARLRNSNMTNGLYVVKESRVVKYFGDNALADVQRRGFFSVTMNLLAEKEAWLTGNRRMRYSIA